MRDYLDVALEVKEVSDDGSFTGYGAVFGNIDSYKDVIAQGAFVESLDAFKLKGRMPAMLWQHRSGEPIGVYTSMGEDANGLFVKGKIAMKTARGSEAYELMKMGAISGMSIGYVTREDSFDKVTGIRTLKKIDLWEVSLVTFPANESARVSSVKNIESIQSLQDVESYLRDAGGFSKSEALALVARVKSIGRSESDSAAELVKLIQKRGSAISGLR